MTVAKPISWRLAAAVFFVTPFVACVLLSPIAAGIYYILGLLHGSVPEHWDIGEAGRALLVAWGLAVLWSAASAVGFVLTHWPFIPAIRWVAKGLAHQALLVAAMVLYGVAIRGVTNGWDATLNQTIAGLVAYIAFTLAVVLAASWHTTRHRAV